MHRDMFEINFCARTTTHLSDYLTPEGVLAFYHNNGQKAKDAIAQALLDGRGSANINCFVRGLRAAIDFAQFRMETRSQSPRA